MKKGNLLLIAITLLIISIVVIFSYLTKLRNNKPENPVNINNVDSKIQKVTDKNEYYMVSNSVKKFYSYYSLMYENIDEENIEKVYSLLHENYISYKKLTLENTRTVLSGIKSSVVNIYDMYVSKQNENISIYIVKGLLREEISKKQTEFQIIIQIDSQNGTFSVILEDYIQEKFKNINIGNTIKIEPLNSIKENRYNLYVKEDIEETVYVLDLFNRYKEELLYNSSLAYAHLDEEYRSKKFGTLSDFEEYLEKNITRIDNTKLSVYQKIKLNAYTQYICIDNYGYYFIFRETGIMEYTVLLDTYTIDLPEFTNKYYIANTVEKVGYNIQKCLDAINSKDYAYVYNKLDFEFKAVNYPTLESFESEMKTKLFEQNEVKSVSATNEGETYIYKLTITDVKDNKKEQKVTIIMQLRQGTDFVMSLSFK